MGVKMIKGFFVVLIVLICCGYSFSSDKNALKKDGNFANIKINILSIPIGNVFSKNDTSVYTNFSFADRIISAILITVIIVIAFTIIGGILTVTGIPLMATGGYNYFNNAFDYSDSLREMYLSLFIAGTICLGIGLLTLIPIVITAISKGVENYRENRERQDAKKKNFKFDFNFII